MRGTKSGTQKGGVGCVIGLFSKRLKDVRREQKEYGEFADPQDRPFLRADGGAGRTDRR